MTEENLEQFKNEICNHFDIVAEDIKDKIQTVSEQVATNSEDITALKTDVHAIKDDVEIIKLDIEFIKNELKQKVSRDEFAALEKRVSMMEIKLNKIR
jgi:regulator of replication initiation timing